MSYRGILFARGCEFNKTHSGSFKGRKRFLGVEGRQIFLLATGAVAPVQVAHGIYPLKIFFVVSSKKLKALLKLRVF